MTGTIAEVALAGLFLVVSHIGVSSTGLRGALVARLGERPYLGLYSLLSVLAFVWLGAAYRAAPVVLLWEYRPWQAWVPVLVNPVALLLVVAGLSTANPSAVGQAALLDRPDPARGILRVTRNPFLWGVGLWALAHMVPNGDAASLLLFGSLAVLALGGTVLLDAKLARRLGPSWDRFAAATSNLPFAAILAERQRLSAREIGWRRLIVALVAYAVILHLHARVFGVPAMPG
ncbi:NnrU family protein [Azospirillum sp. RWY-5-1]|uniref:NnrU family protein n=1 Tax=Azospirillum oleiclasticum TaxID=2735135 RepID=A0ABX2TMC0_9PROT|nr:NnrU family protein [Azospirillum oleiclasticum]NYZ16793.1 NnrU family protein [Azospirillum oleiclasticum]NYZ24473.1 NnrU family protein [Azospirillum oleiclasticum]